MAEGVADDPAALRRQVDDLTGQLAELMTSLLIALGHRDDEELPSVEALIAEVVALRVDVAQARAKALLEPKEKKDPMSEFRARSRLFNRSPKDENDP